MSARIVHPPGWPHAADVRRLWLEPGAGMLVSLHLPTMGEVLADPNALVETVQLRRHSVTCRRCDRDRHVWAPLGHKPRRCDFGACPQCDRWAAPSGQMVNRIEDQGFNGDALRLGKTVPWHELNDRSILEIARYESFRLRERYPPGTIDALLRPLFNPAAWRDLGFAIAEAAFRGLLPTPDELLAAWDLALAHGWAKTDDDRRLTLVDVWALFVPRLRELAQD